METFIVRLWMPEHPFEPRSAAAARGTVRHVRSGRETSFGSWEELRSVLDPASKPADLDSGVAPAAEPAAGP